MQNSSCILCKPAFIDVTWFAEFFPFTSFASEDFTMLSMCGILHFAQCIGMHVVATGHACVPT